jgi:hypothetical protein
MAIFEIGKRFLRASFTIHIYIYKYCEFKPGECSPKDQNKVKELKCP